LVRRIAAYVREAVVGGVLASPRLRRASASALDRPSIEPSAVAAGLATVSPVESVHRYVTTLILGALASGAQP
jgi:hypothetical protein